MIRSAVDNCSCRRRETSVSIVYKSAEHDYMFWNLSMPATWAGRLGNGGNPSLVEEVS